MAFADDVSASRKLHTVISKGSNETSQVNLSMRQRRNFGVSPKSLEPLQLQASMSVEGSVL